MARFTPERRERLLTLLESGRSLEESCADVGVAKSTVNAWRHQGRKAEGGEKAVFAERLDAIQSGDGEARLSEDDVVRMLERSARNGSVQAMRALLARFKEAREPDDDEEAEGPGDPFAAVDQLAAKRQARRAG